MGDNSILNKEWQDVASLKSLFDSPGWKIFEGHIKELYQFEQSYCRRKTDNCLKPEELPDFNFHLAKKQTYKQILMVKDILLDENSPAEEAGANNTSEDQ